MMGQCPVSGHQQAKSQCRIHTSFAPTHVHPSPHTTRGKPNIKLAVEEALAKTFGPHTSFAPTPIHPSSHTAGGEPNIKVAVEEALAKTATTDRVISEDLRPVPKPVKMATLQVLMHERLQAYILQLGVYWKVGGVPLRGR